jgi:hypothetical protein
VINDSENEIETATIMYGSHQIYVQMRKMSLRDGDWLRLRLQACVAINLDLLAVEAGS